MAFNLFGNSASVSAIKLFEIRLERSVIILQGHPEAAASSVLKGTLVLCLSDPLTVKRICLRLHGRSRIGSPGPTSWMATTATRPQVLREETTFVKKEMIFVQSPKTKTEIMPAANYEYPFEFIIAGDSAESVEGLGDSWIIYRLKATLERGILASKVYARKHMRVVRTPDAFALEQAQQEVVIDSEWPGKLKYEVRIPTSAFIFGTSITTSVKLVPILKGVHVKDVLIALSELQEFRHQGKTIRHAREIARAEIQVEGVEGVLNEEGEEIWLFNRTLPLPDTMAKMIQDVNQLGIQISHKLRFLIRMVAPEGEPGQVSVQQPVEIFISPNLMVDERNRLIAGQPSEALVSQAWEQHVPPVYGEHQLDRLWSDIDLNGYVTPANALSEANSPLVRSRNASVENLGSFDALSPNHPGAVPPHALHSRLDNLRDAGGPGLRRLTPISTEHTTSPSGLRRGISSEDDPITEVTPIPTTAELPSTSREAPSSTEFSSLQTAEPVQQLDTSTLSKVPSYQTAVKAPAGTPLSSDLPDYEAATRNSPRPSPLSTTHEQSFSAPDVNSMTGEGSSSSAASPSGPSTGTSGSSLRNRIIRFAS